MNQINKVALALSLDLPVAGVIANVSVTSATAPAAAVQPLAVDAHLGMRVEVVPPALAR